MGLSAFDFVSFLHRSYLQAFSFFFFFGWESVRSTTAILGDLGQARYLPTKDTISVFCCFVIY